MDRKFVKQLQRSFQKRGGRFGIAPDASPQTVRMLLEGLLDCPGHVERHAMKVGTGSDTCQRQRRFVTKLPQRAAAIRPNPRLLLKDKMWTNCERITTFADGRCHVLP